ncbi:unnamed protein product [Plutella xylostella]|uniref:(diamondback moth) hypothetical protein n=1 Tax=Plutella xylostella TaxID=51655 RepID=A0A8S4GCW0_PLUXY|nr:unnamed protein product [Plutella xylostella]
MRLSLSVAGVSFCGSDVGGFFRNPGDELMTRWYQAGAYQPFFRAHSHIETKRREPWLFTASTTQLIRDAVRRRYALIDFWYTLFYEHSVDGVPVMRAHWMQYPQETDTYAIDDQYLLGDKLLVAPVVEEGATSRRVYLPGRESKTVWYDVDSYHATQANGWINVDAGLSKIPVYQRGGTIIARKERVRRSSALMEDDPYTLVVALDKDGKAEGTLYIDDGATYEYKNNKYIYAKFAYDGKSLSYSFIQPKSTKPEELHWFINENASYPTRSWVERIVVAGIKTVPKTAKLHQGDKATALQMTLHKGNDVLVVRKPAAAMDRPWEIRFHF